MEDNLQKKKGVTLKNVAQEAGVSVATASLVLNRGIGSERISKETRELILKIAREMRYRPHYMASALKKQKTMQIGLAIPNIEHPFTPQLIAGVEELLRRNKFYLLLLNMTKSTEYDALDAIRKIEAGGIDGLIILSMDLKLDKLDLGNKPVVYVDERTLAPSICFDARGAASQLTKRFIEKGCRKIAYIGSNSSRTTYLDREEGYVQELGNAGIPLLDKYVVRVEPTLQGGVEAFQWYMQLEDKPEAIITFTDNVAHSMLLHMTGAGIKVPKDVLLASIDDVELSKMMVPSLTCAHVPAFEMGMRAGEIMLELLEGRNLEGVVDTLPVEIRIRQSSER